MRGLSNCSAAARLAILLIVLLVAVLSLVAAEQLLRAARGARPAPAAWGGETPRHAGNAWATLVMSGDDYVPGALVLAESLRMVGTRYPRVCMVTRDVSKQARAALQRVFDRVVPVPVILRKSRPLPGAKQRARYEEEWLSSSFTKWNCLGLPYDKVCFLDADIAFRKNPDAIFDLPAPAGSFVNPWQLTDPIYGYPAHGDTISHKKIRRALKMRNGFVVFGSLVLLRPSCHDYMELYRRLEGPEGSRYGDQFKTHNGPDELSITELYAMRGADWTQIAPHYHTIAWKDYGPNTGQIAAQDVIGYHYFGGEKPWDLPQGTAVKWPDLKTWWVAAESLARRARDGGWWPAVKPYLSGPRAGASAAATG